MARCPCKNTDKAYIDCCWSETTRLAFQNDKNGELFMSQRTFGRGAKQMYEMMRALDGINFDELFPDANEVYDDGVAH